MLKSVNSLTIDFKFTGHGKTSKCCWVWNTTEHIFYFPHYIDLNLVLCCMRTAGADSSMNML